MKFQVGDIVKVIDNTSAFHKVGAVGTVIATLTDSYYVRAENFPQWYPEEQLEMVKSVAPVEEKPAPVRWKHPMKMKTLVLQHPTNKRITFTVKRSPCRHYYVTANKDGVQQRPFKRVGLRHLQEKGYL